MKNFLQRKKRRRPNYRNLSLPQWKQYKQLKRNVLSRDGYKCQYPDCQTSKGLHMHHIKRWVSNVALRFDQNNCIILCYAHHKHITGHEEDYEGLFYRIIVNKAYLKQQIANKKKDKKSG